MGLISCIARKEIRIEGIRQVKYFALTDKGIEIARHVQAMTLLLSSSDFQGTENVIEQIAA